MPEAAEVAVAAAQLHRVTAGRELVALPVTHPRTVRHTDPVAVAALVGRQVGAVRSHGKWIVVDLDGSDAALGIHLRMSGQLLVAEPGTLHPDRHVHATLALGPHPDPFWPTDVPSGGHGCRPERGVEVWFRDPRTFGELRVLPDGAAPVAPDLFDPAVTGSSLHALAARRRVGVKAVLLDQTQGVAGIGSYLADEALHRAGIDPTVPAGELATSAWARILHAARAVATDSVAAGGVTLEDEGWVDLWGRPGTHAAELQVHARPTCATCGTPTSSAVVGGRRARWCRRCQHPRRRR